MNENAGRGSTELNEKQQMFQLGQSTKGEKAGMGLQRWSRDTSYKTSYATLMNHAFQKPPWFTPSLNSVFCARSHMYIEAFSDYYIQSAMSTFYHSLALYLTFSTDFYYACHVFIGVSTRMQTSR